MIAAVLDTGVVASALLRRGAIPDVILRAWRRDAFQLVLSEPILDDLARALARPYFRDRLPDGQAARAIASLRQAAVTVPIAGRVAGVATDPGGDLALATAIGGGATYLGEITILSPRAFLTLLQTRPPA